MLNKVAFGGDDTLVQIGVSQGRGALVEALLNYQTPQAVQDRALLLTRLMSQPTSTYQGQGDPWYYAALSTKWLYELRHADPFHGYMMMQMHERFAIDINEAQVAALSEGGMSALYAARENYEILNAHALGSFDDMLRAQLRDVLMGFWLTNVFNHYAPDGSGVGNENFARELIELFTMGTVQHRLNPQGQQVANYDDSTIQPLAKALSGFYAGYTGDPTLVSGFNGWYSAPGFKILYSRETQGLTNGYAPPQWHYRGVVTLFANTPWATQFDTRLASYDPTQVLDYILYTHPGTSRSIAHWLWSIMAYVHPTDQMVDTLAAQLRTTRYDLKAAARLILNSEAMFSSAARQNCIISPVEQTMLIARKLKLPMQDLFSIASIEGGSPNMGETGLAATGHRLLIAPSVFGVDLCGDNSAGRTTNHGEAWLTTQSLVARMRHVNMMLKEQSRRRSSFLWSWIRPRNQADSMTCNNYVANIPPGNEFLSGQEGFWCGWGEEYDPRTIFPVWNNPTADQVVSQLEDVLDVSLNPAQRTIAVNYLHRPGEGDAWLPSSEPAVRRKLNGLIMIMTNLPQFLLR